MASAMATPLFGAVKMAAPFTSQAYLESSKVKETKVLIADLCRQFYQLGCVTIKIHDDSIPKPNQLIVMSPSVVQKERMVEEDMYVLASNGSLLSAPLAKPNPHKPSKCSDCAPLSLKAYETRDAGAVIHSHGMESCLATMINLCSKEYRAECYHYLFDAAIKLHRLGLDWSTPTHGHVKDINGSIRISTTPTKARKYGSGNGSGPSRRCIILDIEGTTTPISFVTDVLFPYARENVRKHLYETYGTAETQEDIKSLRTQVEEDLEKGAPGAVPIPPNDARKDDIVAALVANVEAMIKADRKITSLKQLQGHIWQTGFHKNELEAVVFDDVPEALERWHAFGIKVYIYSSGSRLAQRLIFGYTNYGDLRKYLCGFFDTTIGNKKETRSYAEIAESLGVDNPSEILFLTDVYQEAIAAKAAGMEVIISVRPGNGLLPENHGFSTIESFSEIDPENC